jgi:prophage DNA circulation protein
MMVADKNMVHRASFGFAMVVCLDLARMCSATIVTMDRVRKAALAETPLGQPAVITVNMIVRLALASEARILADQTFRSRNEVDDIATAINLAFSATAEAAADSLDAETYMALTRLHGDVTRHLGDRGRQLPRVISYTMQAVLPSLRMAQRSYGDPKRHQELINENRVVHPAFMPRTGVMLAV